MRCLVKDCENHSHEGKFIGPLCSPCYAFISGEGGLYSQAYRNARSMIDLAVAAEREACAKVCEAERERLFWSHNVQAISADKLAEAIRARGEK